jgi:chaperone BCS1
MNTKDRYIRFGRAYKTAFLLTGIPGSGKSSLVKSIARKLRRPIYMLNFSKSMNDETFINLMSQLKDDSILLIEDIDAFFVDRQPVNINISFSALINFMDGVLGKGNGVITFLTANNPDRLDPALIRPGRVDIILKFNYPKKQEVKAAFMEMTTRDNDDFEEFYQHIKNTKISMSGIIEYLFRNEKTYMKNIAELLEQTQLLHEIVNDKSDKLYS